MQHYEYLFKTNFPDAGWMWEFIRRNDVYIETCKEIKSVDKAELCSVSGRRVPDYNFVVCKNEHLRQQIETVRTQFYIKPLILRGSSPDASNFIIHSLDDYPNTFLAIPNPSSKYCDFKSVKPHIIGSTAVLAYSLTESDKLTITENNQTVFTSLGSMLMSYFLAPADVHDTIYFGISKRATLIEVTQEIEKMLSNKKGQLGFDLKKRKQRHDKWPDYLMAFDLYNKNRDNKRVISMIQTSLEPKGQNVAYSTRQIKYFLKKARALIQGGFKTYLNLSK